MFVLTRGVNVPSFFVGWHTSPTYTSARARASTCSPEFLRNCGIAAASPQHPRFPSASCVSWRWPSHRHPVQLATLTLLPVTFPAVERLRNISDFQHSFRMSHRFGEKWHAMSMVSSRFTFQALPANNSLSSDLMDAIAVQDVLMASSAYSSVLCQSMSVELRSVVLRYPKHIVLVDFIDLSRNPLQ